MQEARIMVHIGLLKETLMSQKNCQIFHNNFLLKENLRLDYPKDSSLGMSFLNLNKSIWWDNHAFNFNYL